MGRIPKHPDVQRVRRNKVLVQPQKLAPTHDQPVPRMPTGYGWTKHGKEYWKKVWESPMGILYIDADIPNITRACLLVEIIATGEFPPTYLAELRHIEDRLGLSPLARRHLQWDIDRANGLHDSEAETTGTTEDDDRFLRVVGD